jgi:LytS/YehU family sensor histidine kinase
LIKTEGQGFPFEIDLAFIIAGMFLVIFAGVLSRVIRENFRIIKEKSELEQNQLLMKTKLKEVELQSLKSQFHPHFLFNTLNNLYSLSLKKSDEAPEMILKLSELLDYSLHGSEKNKVSLTEEIGFLENYIDLALMRFSNGLEISFEKNIESPQFQLSPLLLIPFVENAIKHGVSPGDKTNLISLRLTQVGKELIFEVENPIVNPDVTKLKDSIRTGIGLNHVKQSLNILYPGAHQLEINEGEKTFSIKLQIHGNY